MKPLFVSGIGTDVGKTVVSAVLVELLKADYWKPVQSGDLHNSDTMKVRRLVSNSVSIFHEEAYRLTQPFSPHKSAALDGIELRSDNIKLPETSKQLIIEGAGGLMVPLNSREYIADLIPRFGAEVILVVKHYLGSINHTLLSIELLKSRGIRIKGLVINGNRDAYSEQAISDYCSIPVLFKVPVLDKLDAEAIQKIASTISLEKSMLNLEH